MIKFKFLFLLFIFNSSFLILNCLCQWVPSDIGFPVNQNVYYFAQDDTRLFAGTNLGLYVPQNDYYNWMYFYSGAGNCMIVMGNIFLIGTESNIYKSTNNGQSFYFSTTNGIQGRYIKSLLKIDNRIYAGTMDNGVYYSTNQGNYWSTCNSGLNFSSVLCLTGDASVIYAGTWGGGIYKSTNQGGNWVAVNSGLTNYNIQVLSYNGQNIFAGTGIGIFRSTTGGGNWQYCTNGISGINIKSLCISSGKVLAGSDSGLYISTDDGNNWNESSAGMTNKNVNAITSFNSVLLAGNLNGTVYHSTNGGVFWQPAMNGLANLDYIERIAVSGNYVFLGTYQKGIWKSSDNGVSWSEANNGITPSYVSALKFNNNDIFAWTYSSGLIRSTNLGQNWQQLINGLPQNEQVNDFAFEPGYIYAGFSDSGVFRTTDNGLSWLPVNNGLSSKYITNMTICGPYIFLSSMFGSPDIYRSSNHGLYWDSCANGVITDVVYDLVPSGNNLYAITQVKNFYVTKNFGTNWTKLNTSNWESNFYNVAIDGNNIFGSNSYSIWYTNNNGSNWYRKNQGFIFGNMGFGPLAVSGQYILTTAKGTMFRRQISEIIGIQNLTTEIPNYYFLEQNYPNPFNSVTCIKFKVAGASPYPFQRGTLVTMKVFDLLGREISTLINEKLNPGTYEVKFVAGNLPSGIYFYQLKAGDFTATKKLIFLK